MDLKDLVENQLKERELARRKAKILQMTKHTGKYIKYTCGHSRRIMYYELELLKRCGNQREMEVSESECPICHMDKRNTLLKPVRDALLELEKYQ